LCIAYFSIKSTKIDKMVLITLAQSFSLFSARDGRQVRRPSWIWATSLCYILLNKFVALVGSGQQTCRPSRDEKGLKDWAIDSCSATGQKRRKSETESDPKKVASSATSLLILFLRTVGCPVVERLGL
jgi:hypothetical protein